MLKKLTTFMLLFGFAGTAFAGTITVTPADCDEPSEIGTTCWTADQNNAEKAADLADWIGGTADDYTLLYKADVGDDGSPATMEEGPFAGSYESTFMNSPLDPEDAWVEYQAGTESIVCTATNPCYAVVKDGNQDPNIYVFLLDNWGPGDDLHYEDFWPNQGAISHVTIWGGPQTTMVPEPGTLALLGLGLFGMGLMRRRS